MKLIIAQGNPGAEYAATRHNIGFMVVDYFASQNRLQWANKPKFDAEITETTVGTEKVILVKPTTFYNETGLAARKLVDFYKLNTKTDVLVIHDDLALPFGTVRVRHQGRDAGNNGIKSLNAHIDHDYTRIRVGAHNDHRQKLGDSDFVIAKFSQTESKLLQGDIIPRISDLINDFCRTGLSAISFTINE